MAMGPGHGQALYATPGNEGSHAGGLGGMRAVVYAFLTGLVFWALMLFAIAIGTTLAFKLIGGKWDKHTLAWSADGSVSGYVANGMAAWSSVADIKGAAGGHDIDVIVAPMLPPVYYDTQPAQANVTQSGGIISHCEIRLHPVHFFALPPAAQQATVTHELGHCIGLDHSDTPSIMMNPSFYGFAADDAQGAIYLYGPKGASAPPPAPPTSLAQAAPETPQPQPTPVPPTPTPVPPAPTETPVKPAPTTAVPVPSVNVPAPPVPPVSSGIAARRDVAPDGWRTVFWGVEEADPAACGCAAVYRDDGQGGWMRWVSGAGFLTTLVRLEPGVTYWMRDQ